MHVEGYDTCSSESLLSYCTNCREYYGDSANRLCHTLSGPFCEGGPCAGERSPVAFFHL